MRHLASVQAIANNDINGPIGAQLSLTVANIAKREEKKFRAQMHGHPDVFRVMAAKIASDNSYCKQRRRDFADHMQQKQNKGDLLE